MTVDAMQFCLVPPGGFVMSENDNREDISAILDYACWMARFPVTNAQFGFFVRDEGYVNKAFWEEAVREGVWKEVEQFLILLFLVLFSSWRLLLVRDGTGEERNTLVRDGTLW